MKAFLAAFDVVPGWVYAATLLVLVVLLVAAKLSVGAAQVEAAHAGRDLSELVATSTNVAASSVQSARIKEGVMAADQAKDVNELNQAISNPDARVTELERGMRDHAKATAGSGGGCLPPAATPAIGGDEQGGAGLRSPVEPDPLVFDGTAQSEIAQLIVSARETGETLKACRRALARCFSSAD